MNRIEIQREELVGLLERVQPALSEADYGKLKAVLETLRYLTDLVADKETTLRQLRQLLLGFSYFPRTTEKTQDVLEKAAADAAGGQAPAAEESQAAGSKEASTPAAGHGRNGPPLTQRPRKWRWRIRI